jgi:hypothetical protein
VKAAPGTVSLGLMLTEIPKLRAVRTIGLPYGPSMPRLLSQTVGGAGRTQWSSVVGSTHKGSVQRRRRLSPQDDRYADATQVVARSLAIGRALVPNQHPAVYVVANVLIQSLRIHVHVAADH